MNFLAHALLAGDHEADRIGGLIGDFIKGPLPGALPADLAAGVALHRAIDSYAEQHPAFIASRRRISPARRRVAGVLVDLFYDHLLARDWDRHHDLPLDTYAAQRYRALEARAGDLPEAARDIAQRMRTGNWLFAYRNVTAVGTAIDRMSIYRMRRANPLAGGIDEFFADRDGFAADFDAFLPDARRFAQAHCARRHP